jgi:transcriptional regulator with XRE-family HTH domain
MIVLREVIGDELRRVRQDQGRTLRDVSAAAAVSLGYLSEVERGQKEASSELLAAICGALDVSLAQVLTSVTTHIVEAEKPTRLDFDGVSLAYAGSASAPFPV